MGKQADIRSEKEQNNDYYIEYKCCYLAVYFGCSRHHAETDHQRASGYKDEFFDQKYQEDPAECPHDRAFTRVEFYHQEDRESKLRYFIGDGIEYLAESADLIEAACDLSVGKIGQTGNDKHGDRRSVMPLVEKDSENRNQYNTDE